MTTKLSGCAQTGLLLMANIFFCADHHIGHNNILQFTREDGTKLRNFQSIEAHDEYLVERHNSVVRPGDRVYFVGDVAMHHRYLQVLGRMNGKKVLVKGNHDIHKLSHYTPWFEDIRGFHQFSGMAISHIPIHPGSLSRWKVNIHGHLHSNRVTLDSGQYDQRYHCVSMEQLDDYTPVSLEQLRQKCAEVLNS